MNTKTAASRADCLRTFMTLIETYEQPPTNDASTPEGAAFWTAWADEVSDLSEKAGTDALMMYLLIAYADYMCDASSMAARGRFLNWRGNTLQLLIEIGDLHKVTKAETADAILTGAAARTAPGTQTGGWIG